MSDVPLKEYLDEKFKDIEKAMNILHTELTERYVTKEEFTPVKQVVYGGVSLILVTVIGALLAIVVTH